MNEAENVPLLVDEIFEVLPAEPAFEVILVDDGSTDGTWAVAEAAATRHPNLRLVRHDTRCGQSAALRSGARAARGDWMVTMDGDRQNDPRDIPALMALATGDVALVGGLRRRRADTLSKRLASRFANWLRRSLLRDDCRDTGCGLKVMRRDVFLGLPYFDALHRFIPALVRLHGHAVAFHEVNDRPRVYGQTKYTNWKRALLGLFDLLGVMWLTRRTTIPGSERTSAPARAQDKRILTSNGMKTRG